jgi:hypothetical protein
MRGSDSVLGAMKSAHDLCDVIFLKEADGRDARCAGL